jgi:hypothetical protein
VKICPLGKAHVYRSHVGRSKPLVGIKRSFRRFAFSKNARSSRVITAAPSPLLAGLQDYYAKHAVLASYATIGELTGIRGNRG